MALRIPVIAHGGVRDAADVTQIMAFTGADAVMAGEGLMFNPAMLESSPVHVCDLALEYVILRAPLTIHKKKRDKYHPPLSRPLFLFFFIRGIFRPCLFLSCLQPGTWSYVCCT